MFFSVRSYLDCRARDACQGNKTHQKILTLWASNLSCSHSLYAIHITVTVIYCHILHQDYMHVSEDLLSNHCLVIEKESETCIKALKAFSIARHLAFPPDSSPAAILRPSCRMAGWTLLTVEHSSNTFSVVIFCSVMSILGEFSTWGTWSHCSLRRMEMHIHWRGKGKATAIAAQENCCPGCGG